jgi:hypothetical protein
MDSGALFSTKDEGMGYAIRESQKPLAKAKFRFAVRRASGTGRHGNAFFVCGPSDRPEEQIECRLYYGGRSSLMITGSPVEHIEEKADLRGRDLFIVTVRVDCDPGTVTFEAAGKTVTARITSPVDKITHYGYGGGNSDNLFTGIRVE